MFFCSLTNHRQHFKWVLTTKKPSLVLIGWGHIPKNFHLLTLLWFSVSNYLLSNCANNLTWNGFNSWLFLILRSSQFPMFTILYFLFSYFLSLRTKKKLKCEKCNFWSKVQYHTSALYQNLWLEWFQMNNVLTTSSSFKIFSLHIGHVLCSTSHGSMHILWNSCL